jgi:hypothetical protein
MILGEVALAGNAALPSLGDRSCWLHRLAKPPTGVEPGTSGADDTIVALCQYDIPPERAFAVALGLLTKLKPRRAIIVGALPVRRYYPTMQLMDGSMIGMA